MASNRNLHKANKQKNDEFYTQLSDIENEVYHYKEFFKNKTVLCNCDDPRVSNFFKFFFLHFKDYGLKRLICTCYKNNDVDLFSENNTEEAVYLDYSGDDTDLTSTDFAKAEVKPLHSNGDFRSPECIELLKQADVVVTNPPFSLFREYVAQLIEYNKKFLIIGNQNAITYKEIFPLIKDNKLWLGYGFRNGNAFFDVPEYNKKEYALGVVQENGLLKFRNCCWFTNIDHKKRHEDLILYKKYTPEEFPKYDNYDAINVNKTSDIPMDFSGVMGVPITFLDKYNPDQFEIVGFFNNYNPDTSDKEKGFIYGDAIKIQTCKSLFRGPVVNGKAVYFRILIKNKKVAK